MTSAPDRSSVGLPSVGASEAADRSEVLAHLRERMVAFAASRYAGAHAEDLAQEVLVVLHEKYPHVVRIEELVPLGAQILRFKLAGLQRKAWRRGEAEAHDVEDLPLPGDAPDPETILARKELLTRLMRGIEGMEARCRDLFRLKLQGRTFVEIQVALGAATLNTVYTWDHRCRKALMARVGGRWLP